MSSNLFARLLETGESIWLDNLSRHLIQSGELERLIAGGIRGITSNPTIFQKAISGSSDYDGAIREMLARGVQDEREVFWALAVEDISRAADLLWSVYQSSGGLDGFVSIEVSPDLAYEPAKTVAEAKRLHAAIGRKNVLVKVPGTRQGLPAIEQLTRDGISVNVTLLFAVKRYEEVAAAYTRGLEARVRERRPVNEIFSVASFFVSRVDTVIDPLLGKRIAAAGSEKEKARIGGLLGAAAVANARIAYKKYREIFWGRRFGQIPGARVQKILWASTGTKNPAYSDIKYVEELIGPDSINTIPDATLSAFLDHGRVQVTIEDRLAEAEKLFAELASLGIDIDQVTDQLEAEGVKSFADSFTSLLQGLAAKIKTFKEKI